MRKQAAILIFVTAMLLSCRNYQERPTSADEIKELNKRIEVAHLENADWTNSPESIARNLFPAVSHDSGPKRYEVTKKSISKSTCIVTVLEEGPIDDEVIGERRTLELQAFTGRWKITDYHYSVKRR